MTGKDANNGIVASVGLSTPFTDRAPDAPRTPVAIEEPRMLPAETPVDGPLKPTGAAPELVALGGSMAERLAGDPPKAVAERDGLRPDPALLVDIAPDRLTLHTRDAYWLFEGQGWDEVRNEYRIIGGRRAGTVLNALRHVAMNGNPYADWFLVCFDEELTALRARVSDLVAEGEGLIETLKAKGLVLNVLASRQPLALAVAFGSSYGYAIAEAVVEFDYYVRVVRTLVLKNRIRADAGRAAIRGVRRIFRRLFVQSIRWERALSSPRLRGMSGRDFLPDADDMAKQRVQAAAALFGQIPQSVLDGTTRPPHAVPRSEAGHEESGAGSHSSANGHPDQQTLL